MIQQNQGMAGHIEKTEKRKKLLKKWLEDNGYDYEARTYMPGGDTEKCVRKAKMFIQYLG